MWHLDTAAALVSFLRICFEESFFFSRAKNCLLNFIKGSSEASVKFHVISRQTNMYHNVRSHRREKKEMQKQSGIGPNTHNHRFICYKI